MGTCQGTTSTLVIDPTNEFDLEMDSSERSERLEEVVEYSESYTSQPEEESCQEIDFPSEPSVIMEEEIEEDISGSGQLTSQSQIQNPIDLGVKLKDLDLDEDEQSVDSQEEYLDTDEVFKSSDENKVQDKEF